MEEAEIWKNCVMMTDNTTAVLLIITVYVSNYNCIAYSNTKSKTA